MASTVGSGLTGRFVFPSTIDNSRILTFRLGLRKYRPISKSGRPLRRFTKRNVSISRHIFATTGKTRTAKQVGSRLQQITESTKDEESEYQGILSV